MSGTAAAPFEPLALAREEQRALARPFGDLTPTWTMSAKLRVRSKADAESGVVPPS